VAAVTPTGKDQQTRDGRHAGKGEQAGRNRHAGDGRRGDDGQGCGCPHEGHGSDRGNPVNQSNGAYTSSSADNANTTEQGNWQSQEGSAR
jgi:hypothetical protein